VCGVQENPKIGVLTPFTRAAISANFTPQGSHVIVCFPIGSGDGTRY